MGAKILQIIPGMQASLCALRDIDDFAANFQ
jgi:hypothetical protein